MKNIVIWFIGSNATGKTTQAALFHNLFRNDDTRTRIFESKEGKELIWRYTQVSPKTANLGRFSHPLTVKKELVKLKEEFKDDYLTQIRKIKPLDCCGTDTLQTKAQIIESFKKASERSKFVVVEGIMATGKWIDFIKNDNNIVFLFLLDIELEENLKRVKSRKANKQGVSIEDVVVGDNLEKNISGKIRGFQSLFKRVKDKCDYSLSLDAKEDKKKLHNKILNFINEKI